MSTLYIDRSRSECGACHGNASPWEAAHLNENMQGEGCGVIYTEVSTHCFGLPDLVERIKEMQPDLPYVGWEPDAYTPPEANS